MIPLLVYTISLHILNFKINFLSWRKYSFVYILITLSWRICIYDFYKICFYLQYIVRGIIYWQFILWIFTIFDIFYWTWFILIKCQYLVIPFLVTSFILKATNYINETSGCIFLFHYIVFDQTRVMSQLPSNQWIQYLCNTCEWIGHTFWSFIITHWIFYTYVSWFLVLLFGHLHILFWG